jgi:hypothetical protein
MSQLDRSWISAIVVATGAALAGCGGAGLAKSADAPAESAPVAAYPQQQAPGGGDFLAGQAPQGAPPAPPPGLEPSSEAAPRDAAKKEDTSRRSAESRPGLGTEWGETRHSRITTVPFVRADRQSPFATSTVFYNDSAGARAMAGGGTTFAQRAIEVGDGIVTFGLRDGDSGRFLTGFESSGRDYVVGEAGQRYVIVVQNHAPMRIEVVVTVDGLDVIDGKPGAFNKRGYLVDPNGTLEIDGFRQSEDAVAAFRFGSVRDSYANRKAGGDARNVGVIGVALFHEQGTSPAAWSEEARRRHGADPFPGRFAAPPPR